MRTAMKKLADSALDLLFPLNCLGCGKGGRFLCAPCVEGLPRLTPPYCPACSFPGFSKICDSCRAAPLAVDAIRTPFLYTEDSLIQKAVIDFKYHDKRAMAPELGGLLASYLASNPMPGDVIIPVPSHPRRLRSRGFNQAALLGRELGKLTGLPVNEKLLARTKNAPPQVRMTSRQERLGNVAESFACASDVSGQAVLLVDDVATTGATMSACAKALKDAGASLVWGLALARAA